MLILSRRVGETIMIGDNIKVYLLNIQGNQAKLGFDAPDNVAVHIEEIYQRINQIKSTEGTYDMEELFND